jgi:Tfp pilus assembly protein PilX
MKIKVSPKFTSAGAALLTALVICSVLSLFVMYYLSLTSQQTLLSARSQSWNTAIAVTESGLEEGLQHLNDDTANLTANGWSYNGSVYQSPTRTFPGGSYYVAVIDMSSDPWNPAVTSWAHENPPTFGYNNEPMAFLADTTSQGSPPVSRAIIVRCSRGNLLIKGMVAKHKIDMNGNNILTDSFDSTDPAKSTGGQYDPNKYVGDNGDVATNDGLANSVGVGNANIYGHVTVGAGGTVAVGGNGAVGEHTWQPSHLGQIETGYFADNANFTFPDQILPYSSGQYPFGGWVGVTNYTLSTNAVVGSPTYPNPLPPDGIVMTNTNVKTVNTWPNQPNTTTNCDSTVMNNGKNPPAAGTYCGTPWQTGQGNNNNSAWYYYPIDSYTYTSYTYTYNLYTTNANVVSTYYDHICYSGDYYYNDGPLGSNGLGVGGNWLILGNARLVLPQGISMTGNDTVQIAQGASLQAFVGGRSDKIAGNGFVNGNGFAVNCQLNFTPTTTSLAFGGNGSFIGTIVAPEANVTMNGSGSMVQGNGSFNYIGALMANTITMNGQYSFHYDESLGNRGANSRFIIKSWNEVDPTTLPPYYFATQ